MVVVLVSSIVIIKLGASTHEPRNAHPPAGAWLDDWRLLLRSLHRWAHNTTQHNQKEKEEKEEEKKRVYVCVFAFDF